MGFLPLALALLAFGDRQRRRLAITFAAGALVFLFFALAGHTPFYRPFFEFLPLLNKIRAMGMVFYLVAFPLALLAGIGMDRVLTRAVPVKAVVIVSGAFAVFALLGAAGGLQGLAESLAVPGRVDAAAANAPALRLGALRLLLFVALGGGALWATASGRINARIATAGLLSLMAVDLWSIDRQFYEFSPRAKTLFASDSVTSYLQQVRPPYRVLDAGDSYGYSILMAYRIPIATGYHGFELQRYDELGGKDTGWNQLISPNLLDLLAIRFVILPKAQAVPGYHQVVAETATAFGTTAVLFERDTVPAYARVILTATKVPEAQTVPTVLDRRFPVSSLLLLPDTSTAITAALSQSLPASRVTASVREWAPGSMNVALDGADSTAGHLLVSENWYPAWHAEVDGKPASIRRADHTLLSVDVPPGARSVRLWFDSRTYAKGKIVSLVALLFAAGMIGTPMIGRQRGT